jgi:Zn-dependent protease with chaperone function
MAKKAYKVTLINVNNLDLLDDKEKVVWDVVRDLAERNHIKMPEVGIYIDTDPNAFAT